MNKVSLPPLKSLRTFESVARLESMSLAADELCVTPAAVTQQIKLLESFFGVKLFQRNRRYLKLTGEGSLIYPKIKQGFDFISSAVSSLQEGERNNRTKLVVTTAPVLALYWLAPRLGDFRRFNPGFDVEIDSAIEIKSFDDGVDIALRLNVSKDVQDQGLTSLPLSVFGDGYCVAVCHPDLIEEDGLPNNPADVSRYPLINHSKEFGELLPLNWHVWAKRFGFDLSNCKEQLTFNDPCMSLQATLQGLGVGLFCNFSVRSFVQSGELVELFPDYKIDVGNLCLVYPKESNSEKINRFKKWIQSS